MNNTTIISSSVVLVLSKVQSYLTILLVVLLIVGIFVNIVTYAIFRQTKHRKNACSIFCAATSVTNVLILFQGFIGILLALALPSDPENYNLIYCKTRLYIRHALIMNNRSFTILSCAACFALSSERASLRLLIERSRLSHRLIIFNGFFWFIFCSHVCFFTTLKNNHCTMAGNYNLVFAVYMFILAGSISPLLMILFSCLVMQNLRKLRHRVRPANNNLHLKKRDFQLIRMLLIHIIVYLLTTVFYPVDLLYSALTHNDRNKTAERNAIEIFIAFLTNNFVFYLNNVAPFFTYYCTSSSFRNELKLLCLKWKLR